MKLIRSIALTLIVFCTVSCEKVLDIKLDDAEPLLVIEGTINNRIDTQTVRISSSVRIKDPNVFPGITGAIVTVTDDRGQVYNFRERAPGIYSARRMTGVPGRTYNLKVIYDGKEYLAESAMPDPVRVDSLGFVKNTFFGSDRISLQVLYTDPPGVPNYYRFVLKVNDVKSRNIFVYSDDFNDGNNVKRELYDSDEDLKEGDRVEIEMQSISQPVYKYWLGLDQNVSRGGASVTPANPVSNISNGALGYFSAHTSQYEITIVPALE